MGIIKTGKIQHSGHPTDTTDIDARVTALEAKNVRALWFAEISSGASGTITPPTGGTIILDQWAAGIDAVTSTLTTTRNPTFESAKTSAGVIITATLDVAGAWTISGTPSAYPIAILYVYDVAFTSFDKTKSLVEIETDQGLKTTDSPTFAGLTDSSLSASKVVVSDANKKHASGTNTDTEIANAVSLKHTQGSDTALGAVGTKNPPIDADLAVYRDSTASNALVTSTWTQIKAFFGLAITAGKTITCTQDTTLAGPASSAIAGPVELATNAESLTGTDTVRAVTPDDLKYVMDIRVQQFYGVTWDESADTYARTGSTAGQAVGVTLADAFLPVQRRMRGCLLLDTGVVNYYLSATDWTKKEDGATASVLTGADGQVMIEIPKFWYRYGYAGTTHTPEISPVPLAGFEPHPAFFKDGAWVDHRYMGAYEGVLYDTSGAAYTDGSVGQVKDWTATTGDKLSSVSGKLAVSNGTRAQFRTIAANRGTGWRQQDDDLIAAIQLLMLTEYASFYTQSVMGAGITNVADWAAYNNYYPIAPSGLGNAIGNATGTNAAAASTAAATVAATGYLKYRGIENPYGHLWKFVDGININNNIPYRTNVGANFTDGTASNYTRMVDVNGADVTLHNADGYVATIQKMKWGFLAASVGASGSTKITDYYYQAAGWRVVLVSAHAGDGATAGAFCVSAGDGSGWMYSHLSGRVCF